MLFLKRFGCKNKSAESSRESYCHWLLIAMQLGNFDRVSRESEAITSDDFTLFSVPHLHYQSSWNTSCVTSWNSSFAKVEISLSIQLEYQQLFHRLEFQPCHYGDFHPEFLDLCAQTFFSVDLFCNDQCMSALLTGARSAIRTAWNNSTRKCHTLPALKLSNTARRPLPRSRVQEASAPRGESSTTAFARRKNAITISSCGQHETRMISIIVWASDASDIVSFSPFWVGIRCCCPEEFPIPQSNHVNLRSQSSFCGIKFHQIHSDLCYI